VLKLESSICPDGESFRLPKAKEHEEELKRLRRVVKEQHLLGGEIVVVMGVGFVGAVMAAVVADSVDAASGRQSVTVP
jgi:hypothetical protein